MTDGSYIYVVNGSNALPRPTPIPHYVTVEKYNIATNTWTYEDPSVLSTQWSAGGMVGGKLMIYAGADAGSAYLNLVQVAQANTLCAAGTPSTSTATPTGTATQAVTPSHTPVTPPPTSTG